jgi:hypothetical protein
VETAEKEISVGREKDVAKANEPLAVVPNIFAFIFPGIYLIVASGLFNVEGYNRKARELRRWTLYGFCFYIAIVLLMIITSLPHNS